jgi:hypothetical protein
VAYPKDVESSAIVTPPSTKAAGALVELGGLGLNSDAYLSGSVSGTVLSYPDAASFAWYDLVTLYEIFPERIRSSYDVTLGRTLVGTPQADVSAEETVPRINEVTLGTSVLYPTMLRPLDTIARLRAIEDQGGSPIYEQPLAYETRLAALSRMFPPSVYATTLDAIGTSTATAQEVLQYLFDEWTELFPEFSAKPVPPLVLFVEDDDGRYTRTLTTDRIYLRQPEDRERSLQTILEEFRAIFVGYGVSVDADGDVVIIPPPWAVQRDRDATILEPAYFYGPGPDAPLSSIGAAGRTTDVSAGSWTVDPAFDGAAIEVSALVTILPSTTSSVYTRSGFDLATYRGTRTEVALELEPNTPARFTRQVTPWFGGEIYAEATYELEWSRPGATGGSIEITVITATTSADVGLFGDTRYWAHALTLDGYGLSELGVLRRTVDASELKLPLPEPVYDGSRVINRQTARYEEIDFVEDTALLATLGITVGATTYEPPGAALVTNWSFQPFVDEDGEPLIIGDRIDVEYTYLLRQSRTSGGSDEVNSGLEEAGTVTLRPGDVEDVTFTLSGEVTLTYGDVATVRFAYGNANGVPGLITAIVSYGTQSDNVFLTRPYLGHVLTFTATGSVYGETGVQLEVTYDEEAGGELVQTSQALYGVREGPRIDVPFFRVTEQDLLDVTEAIVRFNMRPRARYVGLELTEASEITPGDLGRELLLPIGVSAVLERYAYRDDRSYDAVSAGRRLDLVYLYDLASGGGTPAAATDDETSEATAGIYGLTYFLDAD